MAKVPIANQAPTEAMQKIMDREIEDWDQIEKQPRFGFFSIPPNQVLGDRYYSLNKEYHHKIVEGKVITEKRGIFTQPPKSGKGRDAYFDLLVSTYEPSQELLKKGNADDKTKLLSTVKKRKEQGAVPHYYPPHVQEYKDWFDLHPFERNYPLTKQKSKHFTVTADHKVITGPRGIFTQPMKKGLYNTPGTLFSFTPFREDLEAKDVPDLRKPKPKRPKSSTTPGEYHKPFFPASLKKCDAFVSDKETYGYQDEYYNKLKEDSDKIRKSKGPKYEKKLPSNAIKHMRPFTPASLGKVGRDGLFDQHIWDCPQIPEKKVIINQKQRKEYEDAHRKVPFTYNKLMKHTHFSPSIMQNPMNMKREFPTVYKF